MTGTGRFGFWTAILTAVLAAAAFGIGIATIGSLAAIVAAIGLSVYYGKDLDYRFEITVLTIDWTMLIVSGVLLSIWFRQTGSSAGTERVTVK